MVGFADGVFGGLGVGAEEQPVEAPPFKGAASRKGSPAGLLAQHDAIEADLGFELECVDKPEHKQRADGLRAALRVLLTGRKGLDTRRTADRNALNALVRTTDLGVDAARLSPMRRSA